MYKYFKWRMRHPTADGGQTGSADTGTGEQTPAAGEANPAEGEANPAEGEGDAPPKEENITLAKSELEKQIERAEKRGARLARTGKAAKTPAAAEDEDAGMDVRMQEAESKMQAANQRMLAADVKSLGTDKGLTANGLAVAAKFIDPTHCLDEHGNVDADAVAEELDAFVEKFPEFKKQAAQKPSFVQMEGATSGTGPTMSKEAIMKIKDPVKRRKAIEANISLFQH